LCPGALKTEAVFASERGRNTRRVPEHGTENLHGTSLPSSVGMAETDLPLLQMAVAILDGLLETDLVFPVGVRNRPDDRMVHGGDPFPGPKCECASDPSSTRKAAYGDRPG
jgi:hypothetical protein